MIDIFSILFPVILILVAATMLVNRAGASRVFFDVVGTFQANRLIADVDAKMGVINSIMLDGLSGIGESVGLITDQMQMLVDSTVPLAEEVSEARLEFEKFASTIEGSEELRQNIIGIGQAFGFNAAQAQEAGARMAQLSGVFGGAEAIEAATAAGIQFGMIGGMETQDAMQRLIQLHQQTNALYGDFSHLQFQRMSAEQQANVVRAESARLLDQLNTIENRSAATMQHITHVMNQFAASGQLAGDSIAFMAAASATLIEAGEEQGKAGRALRMMYARLGADTGKNSEILRQYGVETKDANGNLRSMEEILGELSIAMEGRSEAEKLAVAQAIAGNDHYVRAIKLIDNYGRTMALTTQATKRLDSAQDEANKKLEDQLYLLKEAEARLFNAKAAVGDALMPVTIRQTNAQAALNEQFALFAQTPFGEQFVMVAGVMQTYIRGLAPLGEALLNIMSLNVSLQTQQTILRALNNEEIVRASAYGGRTASQKMSLMMLDQELFKLDQVAKLRNVYEMQSKEDLIAVNQLTNAKHFASAIETHGIRSNIKLLQQEIDATDGVRFAVQTRYAASDANQKEEMMNQLATLNNLNRLQQEYEEMDFKDQARLNVATMIQAQERNYLNAKEKELSVEEQIALIQEKALFKRNTKKQVQAEVNNLQNQEMNILKSLLTMEMQFSELRYLEKGHNKSQIENTKARLNANAQLLQQEGMKNIALMMQGKEVAVNTDAYSIQNMAIRDGVAALSQKGNFQQRQNQIEALGSRVASELAIAYGLQEKEVRKLVMQMPLFIQLSQGIKTQQDAQMAAQMRLNSAMMTASGVLGAMSMLLTMFSDSEDAARAGMVLMMLSMIPMTAQMFIMTKQSMAMAGSMLGVGAAGPVAAGGVGIFSKAVQFAMSTTGIGLITVALGAFAAFALDFGSATESMTQDVQDLGSAVTYSREQFDAMRSTMEGMELEDMGKKFADKQKEVNELEDALAEATDATNKRFLQKRLDMRRQELFILNDILAQETSLLLLSGEEGRIVGEDIFTKAQEYNDLIERLEKDEKTALAVADITTRPERKAIDYLLGHTRYSDYTVEQQIKDAYEDMEDKALDDLLADVPEAMHGFVLDTALASDTLEEFFATVELFGTADFSSGYYGVGEDITNGIIGPIEAAKEAMFEFSNAREEMFFGMAKGNISGEMIKQVVNKGVETLVNTVEVIQTNNFNGMTTKQAADAIVTQIEQGLTERGINLER